MFEKKHLHTRVVGGGASSLVECGGWWSLCGRSDGSGCGSGSGAGRRSRRGAGRGRRGRGCGRGGRRRGRARAAQALAWAAVNPLVVVVGVARHDAAARRRWRRRRAGTRRDRYDARLTLHLLSDHICFRLHLFLLVALELEKLFFYLGV